MLIRRHPALLAALTLTAGMGLALGLPFALKAGAESWYLPEVRARPVGSASSVSEIITAATFAAYDAGPAFQGTIKSATAFGALLSKGIGDTIRVSLSAPPVEEIKVGQQILQSLGLRPRKLEIVSCPSCGRAQVDVYKLADEVTAGLEGMTVPLRVAVMGCVVNGPGEAREADLGVASGNGKGQIFVKGEVIKTVPESKIVETLIEEALRIAEEMGEPIDEEGAGSPTVTVG